jgi:hypothetical protein
MIPFMISNRAHALVVVALHSIGICRRHGAFMLIAGCRRPINPESV